jgi:tetratricopeptide (TPR) repeat protein
MTTNLDIERLKDLAVEKAVEGNYEEAISINKQILEEDAEDIQALMQLAHAYWQIGNLSEAKAYYKKTLAINPNHNLATKRLSLLNAITAKDLPTLKDNKGKIVPITDLIEEPGKTKIIKLSHVGKPHDISMLSIGEEIFLNIRKRKIEIRDICDNFIGYLPDDISRRLIEFIQNKGVYEAFVFSIDRNEIKVFVREVKRSPKFKNSSTFIYEDFMPQTDIQIKKNESLESESIDEEDDDTEEDIEEVEEDEILTPEELLEKEAKEKSDEEDDEDSYEEYEE